VGFRREKKKVHSEGEKKKHWDLSILAGIERGRIKALGTERN